MEFTKLRFAEPKEGEWWGGGQRLALRSAVHPACASRGGGGREGMMGALPEQAGKASAQEAGWEWPPGAVHLLSTVCPGSRG